MRSNWKSRLQRGLGADQLLLTWADDDNVHAGRGKNADSFNLLRGRFELTNGK